MRLRPLATLLFCSGAAALILEVAWFRRMAQITGATSIALAAVLAAVIGGMALGAWWIGRRADRTARPLRLYAVLETGVALFALASPVLLDSSQTLFTALRRALPDSPAALLTARFLLAVALLTPPAILLGGTLPAMAAALRSRREDLGRGLGLLYAWNTLGAVAGTLLAGFVLLPSLGLFGTMHMAFFFSAIAAAGGFFWGGKRAAAKDAAIVQHSFCAAQRRNALRLYAASGFLGMAAQVAFARSLVLVFGSTTYAFTTMLAIFLFGIATGGALGTRWTSPPEKVLRRLATTVALTAALFSVSALAVYFLPRLYLLGYLEIGNSFEAGIALRFLLAGCVLLPGTIGLGVAFPLAARVAGEGAAGAGTGRLYAANTAASVLGSTLAVFALVPWIGPQGTVALVAVCVATVVAALARRRGLVALILLSATGFVPPSATARERLLSGVYYTPNRYLDGARIDDSAWQDGSDIPYFEYGRDATVSILRWYGQPGVLVDGKAVATAQNITDVHHLELLGHIPMLLHPGSCP